MVRLDTRQGTGLTQLEEAIVTAVPHDPFCRTVRGEKCNCGAVGRRAVLYSNVQDHVQKVTRGRVYLR